MVLWVTNRDLRDQCVENRRNELAAHKMKLTTSPGCAEIYSGS